MTCHKDSWEQQFVKDPVNCSSVKAKLQFPGFLERSHRLSTSIGHVFNICVDLPKFLMFLI